MIRATLLISALVCASAAYAGDAEVTLSGQKGTVMVNSGKQFVSAKAGQSLKQGDRVMVMEGGTATVTYPNGCVATVQSGSMIDVNASTCGNNAKKVGTMYAQAVGDNDDRKCDDNDRDKYGKVMRDSAGHPIMDADGHTMSCGAAETADVEDEAHPPFWAVFAGWAAITVLALSHGDADGISTP
ncbi:MAG: hypothetical protein ABIQ97_00285 [Lysobacteraceae bacterium]